MDNKFWVIDTAENMQDASGELASVKAVYDFVKAENMAEAGRRYEVVDTETEGIFCPVNSFVEIYEKETELAEKQTNLYFFEER